MMKNLKERLNKMLLYHGFFGLDNALPSLLLCNQLGGQLDGMPVNFKYPLECIQFI